MRHRWVEWGLPALVLALLAWWTYAFFFDVPYPGFRWRSDGRIYQVYVEVPPDGALQVEDRLLQVGAIPWALYRRDLNLVLFEDAAPGEVVPLRIERAGEERTILWTVSGPTDRQIRERLLSQWWLPFIFWAAGTLTALRLRPQDRRWLLLVLFYFITAIWLGAGSGLSHWHWGGTPLILRMAIWLSAPIYWHLHWLFPEPLGSTPRWFFKAAYGVAALLALAQLFQWLPSAAYYLGLLAALGGALLLLGARLIWRPKQRSNVLLIFVATLLGVLPALLQSLVKVLDPALTTSGGAVLTLPALPAAYFYIAYRRQLGAVEWRTNRLITWYLFATLLGSAIFGGGLLIHQQGQRPGLTLFFLMLVSVVAAIGYPAFERFVERYLLGIQIPARRLLETYLTRIVTRLDVRGLVQVLHEEVLPSLLIRESALLRLESGRLTPIASLGIPSEGLPTERDFPPLESSLGSYRNPATLPPQAPCPWARVILPLQIEKNVLGLWLLGRRDPDDFYAQHEIDLLRLIAHQTALALSNVDHAEHLQTLYQSHIAHQEKERGHLARELHDVVLSPFIALMMSLGEQRAPPFQEQAGRLVGVMRGIMRGLRSPSLRLGLHAALEEWVDAFNEQYPAGPNLYFDVPRARPEYPRVVEEHLFRIIQQAVENALRHAQAQTIFIEGRLDEAGVDLAVQDDGVGFEPPAHTLLAEMAEQGHYGLVNMLERAELIGARLQIQSLPGEGTRIELRWCREEAG